MTKYDFLFCHEKKDFDVYIKHSSTNDKEVALGKLNFFANHTSHDEHKTALSLSVTNDFGKDKIEVEAGTKI